jgi:hypothetical protein
MANTHQQLQTYHDSYRMLTLILFIFTITIQNSQAPEPTSANANITTEKRISMRPKSLNFGLSPDLNNSFDLCNSPGLTNTPGSTASPALSKYMELSDTDISADSPAYSCARRLTFIKAPTLNPKPEKKSVEEQILAIYKRRKNAQKPDPLDLQDLRNGIDPYDLPEVNKARKAENVILPPQATVELCATLANIVKQNRKDNPKTLKNKIISELESSLWTVTKASARAVGNSIQIKVTYDTNTDNYFNNLSLNSEIIQNLFVNKQSFQNQAQEDAEDAYEIITIAWSTKNTSGEENKEYYEVTFLGNMTELAYEETWTTQGVTYKKMWQGRGTSPIYIITP